MALSEIVKMDGLALSHAIQSKQASCVEVMNAYLDHIDATSESRRESAVFLGGLGGQQAATDGLGEQRVPQLHVVAGRWLQQPSVGQPVETGGKVGGSHPGRVCEERVGQRPVRDPEDAGDGPGGCVEAVESPVEKVGQPLGQCATTAGVGDELLGEQWLPLAASVYAVDVAGGYAQQVELLGGLVPIQQADGQLGDRRQAAYSRQPVDHGLRRRVIVQSPGADQGYGAATGEQVLEQVQGGRIRPVQVLDQHRQRAQVAQSRQQPHRRR